MGLFACSLHEGTLRAQSDEERAAARLAAQQGVTAWREGRYADAIDLLGRAEAVVHAPPHLLYMARAYSKQGKLVKAREMYIKLTKEQLGPGAPKAFADARADASKELVQLEPRLAYVKINVEGTAPNLRVLVDDQPVSAALLGIARPSDPGVHKYQAVGEGAESDVLQSKVDEGAQQTLTLTLRSVLGARGARTASAPAASDRSLPHKAATESASPPAAPLTVDESPSPGRGLRVVSYVALGAGAIGLGAAGYFQYMRFKREDMSAEIYDYCSPRRCSEEEQWRIEGLDERAVAAQKSAYLGFVLGGLGVTAGVTMLILDASRSSPSAKRSETHLAIRPWIAPQGVGMVGTF